MFDIHLPHKPIHGVWEFFIHLFTITVGLLIAVQIESCVEWRHHVHLAEEARTSLRAEIEQNLKGLKEAQPGLKTWRASNDVDLAIVNRIQQNPADADAQNSNLAVNFSGISLDDTAWRTAQSTGALAYMPYQEAQRYSNVYQAQAALTAALDKPLEDATQIVGLTEKTGLHSSPSHKITAAEAGEFAEKFGQMRMHLANVDTQLRISIEQCEAFIENRKAHGNFTEILH